jgi:hypothetical protein
MAKRKVRSQIGNLTPKNQESPWFPCMQVACDIPLKRSRQRLQLFFRPHFNRRSACKVISRQNRGSPGTKWHLGVGSVTRHKVYYKGEGGGFSQVQTMVNLVSLCLPMVRLCTKVLQLRINQLVVWFVQVCVNDWIVYQSS